MILYQIEYVFFYPIGGRSGVHAGHGLQFTAPRSSGYNSHDSLLLKFNDFVNGKLKMENGK